jgi:hypothetical protein
MPDGAGRLGAQKRQAFKAKFVDNGAVEGISFNS